MAPPLFVFGTLRHDALRRAVAGSALPGTPAVLPGHAVARALGPDGAPQPFPILTPRPGAGAEGLLLAPDAEQQARLDLYERLFRYRPEPVEVLSDGQTVSALVYRAEEESWAAGPDWEIDAWARDWAALRTGAAEEVMALWPRFSLEALQARYPMIEIAVDSRLRAQAAPAPAALRRAMRSDDVASAARRRPYAWYFGVQEDDLRYRRFEGGQSRLITRAGFVMGDAVTVLPYDPLRDRVLLVEQFRYGSWLRGDTNAWSLEPVAGRIDPGETPEAAARRETEEEARLSLGALHLVARYYPSPGAVSEFVFSYLAIADLPDEAEGIAGLDVEDEDIRAHVIGYGELQSLVASGEANNGPLLLTAFWLAGQRERLRADAAPGP